VPPSTGRIYDRTRSVGNALSDGTLDIREESIYGLLGIRVFNPQGNLLGTIPAGVPPQSVGFAGRDKKTLFIVGRGAVYKTQMIAEGIRSRAK
jgi:sugar lactone lactonase YvrE